MVWAPGRSGVRMSGKKEVLTGSERSKRYRNNMKTKTKMADDAVTSSDVRLTGLDRQVSHLRRENRGLKGEIAQLKDSLAQRDSDVQKLQCRVCVSFLFFLLSLFLIFFLFSVFWFCCGDVAKTL